jgi:2-amino-4-hydroxy-6-hydroxymethyldihydropteridine diphosphokinase
VTPAAREGYLGLGSNVGNRRANLQAAVHELRPHGVEVLASSSVYETEPVGEVLDQRDFLNACVRIRTTLDPESLLDACKAVERELGRIAGGVRHGPRPIDVDVLLLGDDTFRSDRLSLPHEQVTSRRFVLVPLLELAPDLHVPGAGPAAAALAGLGDEGAVRRAGVPLEVDEAAPRS